MSFSFYPMLIGIRVNIQFSVAVNKFQSTSEIVSVQAYSKDSWWGKFKVLIGQAERFKDAKGNEYILNMRSLGKAFQLTEGKELSKINARTKMATFNRFFPEATPRTLEIVVKKCAIVAQSRAEQINNLKKIALCKKNPVLNTGLTRQIDRYITIQEGAVIGINFYLQSNGGILISNFGKKVSYMTREELGNSYYFKADLYLEKGVFYINLKKDTAEYIEARSWRDGTLNTWIGESTQQKVDEQYENALAVICKQK